MDNRHDFSDKKIKKTTLKIGQMHVQEPQNLVQASKLNKSVPPDPDSDTFLSNDHMAYVKITMGELQKSVNTCFWTV